MRYPRDIGDTRRKSSTKVGLLKTGESLTSYSGAVLQECLKCPNFRGVYSLTCDLGTPVKAA